MLYKIVEGLIPAMPPENFITPQRKGRPIKPKKDPKFSYPKNPIERSIRNNDRSLFIPPTSTVQYRNSFFLKTAIEWNHLTNTTVHSKSPNSFKTAIDRQLGIGGQHQQPI